jgi:hypothetical protein
MENSWKAFVIFHQRCRKQLGDEKKGNSEIMTRHNLPSTKSSRLLCRQMENLHVPDIYLSVVEMTENERERERENIHRIRKVNLIEPYLCDFPSQFSDLCII